MHVLTLILSLLVTTTLSAQLYTFQFDWKKLTQPYGNTLSDNTLARSVVEVPGTGFVWAGYKFDSFNATDIWIQKVDYAGNVLWDTTFGGDLYDEAHQLRVLPDGSIVVLGTSSSTNISNNYHSLDVVLIKYRANGQLAWWKRYGTADLYHNEYPTDVRVCKDGGFVVTGAIPNDKPDGTEHFDAWIFKTDSLGMVEWDRRYGGYWDDAAQSVVQTPDEGFAVAVSANSSDGDFDVHTYETDVWLLKLNEIGLIQWKKHYGGTQSEYWYHIEMAPDGGFILSGEIEPGSDLAPNSYGVPWDAWVCRVSAQGDLLWSRNFGGSKGDGVREMSPGASGWYWIAGFTLSDDHDICRNRGESDYWVFAVNLDGNLMWSQTFGGSGAEHGLGIYGLPDGFISCGTANSKDGDVGPLEPYQSGWLLKIRHPGTFQIDFPSTDTVFCGSGSITLSLPIPDSISVQWNTGQIGHEAAISAEGLYVAEASLYGCRSADSLWVSVIPRPALPGDTVLCFRDSLLLTPDVAPDRILWGDGSEAAYIWAGGGGTYTATMFVENCAFQDTVTIDDTWCDEEEYCFLVPNVFTPNGDGLNDYFGPVNRCGIVPENLVFAVYNRWGQKVFESDGASWPSWDGRDFPVDVYVWRCILTFDVNGSRLTLQKQGDVTLLR